MGKLYAAGALPESVRTALKNKRLSISPLEYAVALVAVAIWLERWEELDIPARQKGALVVGRCDNESSCLVSRRRMAMCPSMAWCTARQWDLEQEFGVQILLDHIPGDENVGPDALSRGWTEKAMQGLRDAGVESPVRFELGEMWGSWLEGLVEAVGDEGAGDEIYWNRVQDCDLEDVGAMGEWR